MTPSDRESGLARPAAAGRSVPFSKANQCCRRRRSTPPEILGREPALSPCFQRNSGPMNCRQGTPIQLPVEASDLNVSGFLTISKAIRRAFFPYPTDRLFPQDPLPTNSDHGGTSAETFHLFGPTYHQTRSRHLHDRCAGYSPCPSAPLICCRCWPRHKPARG